MSHTTHNQSKANLAAPDAQHNDRAPRGVYGTQAPAADYRKATNGNDYLRIVLPVGFDPSKHRHVGRRRDIPVHIYKAERALGKPLPDAAEVHHFDENARNNANTNLVICENVAYHQLLHYRQKVVAAGYDPDSFVLCVNCGYLPIDLFYRNKNTCSGRVRFCKSCCSKTNPERKRRSIQRRNALGLSSRGTPLTPYWKSKLAACRNTALRSGKL